MMKNKKLAALLGLLLAGSMTVSMAACGSTNSASDTKADSSSQFRRGSGWPVRYC